MAGSKAQTSLEYGFALSSVKGLGNTRIKRLITYFGNLIFLARVLVYMHYILKLLLCRN